MNYTIHTLQQGSAEWHAHRNGCYNGSDLSAAMGISSYKSRTDIVRQIATGEQQEIDAATQRRFDDGHRFEALARPLAEEIIGAFLYPITVSTHVDGLNRPLSSSLDGATDADVPTNFEHKGLNARLAEYLAREEIPEEYWPQMEQGMLINGAERTLFMASLWNENDELIEGMHCWYESRPELRAKIVPTWKQIEADVFGYVPQEVVPAAVAEPQQALPAVFANVQGSIEVRDNLAVFGDALRAYIDRLNMQPETDQDFANLDASAKLLRETQERIKSAKDGALGQIASIDTMKRIADQLEELARTTAISIENLVKAEKQNRKNAIIRKGQDALRAHIDSLNTKIGKPYMPEVAADFVGAGRGLKTMTSLQNAINTELARAKIEADQVASRIEANLKTLRDLAKDHTGLFADAAQLVLKDTDAVEAIVKSRIADAKAAEEKRLEAERERIHQEEEARAAAKVESKTPAAQIGAGSGDSSATAPSLAQVLHTAAPTEIANGKRMKLGEINALLYPLSVSAEVLKHIGFEPEIEKNAKLYRAHDFQAICSALVQHIINAANSKVKNVA